ncbi:MAG: TetR/AcrR family transcriptional regulator [Tabrizicola sp.]
MTTDAREQRILAAAQALFIQHGYRATRMEAVAKAAGVAKATLYSRYPDKDALFRAGSAQVMTGFRAAFDAAMAQPGTPPQRFIAAFSAKYAALSELLGGSPHAGELIAEHARLCPDEHAALTVWFTGELARMLADDNRPDAEELARVTVAAVEGVKQSFPQLQDFTRLLPLVVGKLLA